MKWLTRTTVTPVARIRLIRAQVARRACGSRPVVSSSRNATRGLPTNASAMNSRCFCPPDSLPNRGVALVLQPPLQQQLPPVAGFCVERGVQIQRLPHLEVVRQLRVLQLDADLLAQRAPVLDRVETEHPDRPAVGRRRPSTHSTAVVLPAPFGPRMPKISPSSTLNDTTASSGALEITVPAPLGLIAAIRHRSARNPPIG